MGKWGKWGSRASAFRSRKRRWRREREATHKPPQPYSTWADVDVFMFNGRASAYAITQIPHAATWPPSNVSLGQLLAGRPPQPPYLTQRPSAPVAIGSVRSLFVDDLLLANRSAPRVYHQAVFKAVVLKPTPAEWVSEHKTHPTFELAWVGRGRGCERRNSNS